MPEGNETIEREMLTLPKPQVRRVSPNDLPTIAELEDLCFSDPYPTYFLTLLAKDNPDTFLVAEQEGRIVGYAVTDRWRDHNHLVSIAVHPQHRRNGLGQMLLDRLEEGLGGGLMKLELRKTNLAALQFYLNNGFKRAGVREGYYGDGEDAILMEKRLGKGSRSTS